jgi:hypothetical protein
MPPLVVVFKIDGCRQYLFIQLQCSVDDETFMAHINVASSFSHSHFDEEIGEEEEQFVVDEHDEGMIEPSRGRTANYTMKEDMLFCQT